MAILASEREKARLKLLEMTKTARVSLESFGALTARVRQTMPIPYLRAAEAFFPLLAAYLGAVEEYVRAEMREDGEEASIPNTLGGGGRS